MSDNRTDGPGRDDREQDAVPDRDPHPLDGAYTVHGVGVEVELWTVTPRAGTGAEGNRRLACVLYGSADERSWGYFYPYPRGGMPPCDPASRADLRALLDAYLGARTCASCRRTHLHASDRDGRYDYDRRQPLCCLCHEVARQAAYDQMAAMGREEQRRRDARKRGARQPLPVLDCKGCGACCRHMGHPPFPRDYGGERAQTLPGELFLYDFADDPVRDGTPMDGYVPVKLPPEVEAPLLAYYRDLHDDDYGQPCVWLAADGTCAHYDLRPYTCREFEVGGEDCLRLRREAKVD
jgi:Fe-S-cluster containining protein